MATIMNVLEQMPEINYEERYEYLNQITEITKQESLKFSTKGIKADDDIKEYYNARLKMLEDKLMKYKVYIGKESDISVPSDEEKRKTVIRAFGESEVTQQDIAKAEEMLGFYDKANTVTQTK